MNIYTDKLQHKDESYVFRKDRDNKVKELRKQGWTVKTGCFNIDDGRYKIYWYKAEKEKEVV